MPRRNAASLDGFEGAINARQKSTEQIVLERKGICFGEQSIDVSKASVPCQIGCEVVPLSGWRGGETTGSNHLVDHCQQV